MFEGIKRKIEINREIKVKHLIKEAAAEYDSKYPVNVYGHPVSDYIPFLTIPFPEEFRDPKLNASTFIKDWPFSVDKFVPEDKKSQERLRAFRSYARTTYDETLDNLIITMQLFFMFMPYENLTAEEREVAQYARYMTWQPGYGKEEKYYKEYASCYVPMEQLPWIGLTDYKFDKLVGMFVDMQDQICQLVELCDSARVCMREYDGYNFSYEQALCANVQSLRYLIAAPRLAELIKDVLTNPCYQKYWNAFLQNNDEWDLTSLDIPDLEDPGVIDRFRAAMVHFVKNPYDFKNYYSLKSSYEFGAPGPEMYVDGKKVL